MIWQLITIERFFASLMAYLPRSLSSDRPKGILKSLLSGNELSARYEHVDLLAHGLTTVDWSKM